MTDDTTATALRHRLTEVRDSMSDVHMTIPDMAIFASARKRRTRRGIAALAAGCAAIGVALALVVPGGQARAVHVHLAAWSVDSNGNGTVTVTVRQLTHAAQLQRALAEAGVPAVVTFREECLNTQNQNALTRAGVRLRVSVHPSGEIITPSEIPSGTKLLFSIIPVVNGQGARSVAFGWGLVRDGKPLHCVSAKLWQIHPKAVVRATK